MINNSFAPLSQSSQKSANHKVEKQELSIIIPVPENASPPDFIHNEHGKPSVIYPYKDRNGRLNGYTCRFDYINTDGSDDKEVLPFTYWKNEITGVFQWKWKGFPEPRPLYGLEKLAANPEAVIVISEGEKSTDALVELLPNHVGLTSSGGNHAAGKSDWSDVKSRDVIIWPDNDKAGMKYADDVQRVCMEVGAASAHIMRIPKSFPEKWDAADALLEGWTAEKAEDFLKEALDSKQFQAITLQDFLKKEILPREMILNPIIPQKGLVMLHAVRGIGKTHVALGIAYAVATGGKFLRWEAPKPRKVLLVDGEMPEVTLQERLRGIVKSSNDQVADEYFRILAQDAQESSIPSLHTKDGREAIKEHLDGVELLIIDNISTLCGGGAEDKADDWQPIQDWLLELRRNGIAVLLIHHSGKTGRQRGTSRREDVLDTVIALKKPDDYSASDGARFIVKYEKARGIFGDDAASFEANLTVIDNITMWEIKSLQESEDDLIKKFYKEGLSIRDIERKTGIPKSTVGRRVKEFDIETVPLSHA